MPAQTDEELQEVLAEQLTEEDKIFLHDGTEREIPRPQDDEAQESKYSGKKKRHTVKNAVIISCCCMALYVSPTFDGQVHDKKQPIPFTAFHRVFTLLNRRIAVNLLKNGKTTKAGIWRKRLKAGWDNHCLIKLLKN